jgi:hypothetical protein
MAKKPRQLPYGSVDRPFDACHLAEAAGATYVARSTAFHVQHLTDMIAGMASTTRASPSSKPSYNVPDGLRPQEQNGSPGQYDEMDA